MTGKVRWTRKGRADIDFTGDDDTAADLFDQLAGDGQAKAGAAGLARGRSVGLGEDVEDVADLMGWNADTGIDGFDVEHHVVLGRRRG